MRQKIRMILWMVITVSIAMTTMGCNPGTEEKQPAPDATVAEHDNSIDVPDTSKPELQAGTVAGRQQRAVPAGQSAVHDRPDRVNDIAAWQVERRRDFCPPRRLVMPLSLHQLRAGKTELHPREGMNGVVNAAVIRTKAAKQSAVGGIDNGVAPQGGNVPLPEVGTGPGRGQVPRIGHSLPPDFLLQVRVLHPQERLVGRQRGPDVEQRPGTVRVSRRSCASRPISSALLSLCVMSGIEESGGHIQVVLARILRIPGGNLRFERLRVPALRRKKFQIFQIGDFGFGVLEILWGIVRGQNQAVILCNVSWGTDYKKRL